MFKSTVNVTAFQPNTMAETSHTAEHYSDTEWERLKGTNSNVSQVILLLNCLLTGTTLFVRKNSQRVLPSNCFITVNDLTLLNLHDNTRRSL